ncbi:hypothetical protein JTE90_027961 [Oedothorax gibbosus]|uniref:BHLH domain-containing protein n=1 Tax=Oedothorax gibbosus TaxID=931172 RepID=A0AAV6VF02_9ARAC|nr:hypothetical protein JTE90_027961 [Oedothorax gibbosus]
MGKPAQVNHVSSQSVCKKSSTRNTKRTQKSVQIYEGGTEQGMSRNAARERYRVRSLRTAFASLQRCLPSVPLNTKLPKLDVLVLAASYIAHLTRLIGEHDAQQVSDALEGDYSISASDFELIEGSLATLTEPETRSPSWEKSYLHPVKKWPMRSRLYAGVDENDSSSTDYTASFNQSIIQWN